MKGTKEVKKKYAPVIIPTLCRYEHFVRCLESLENCTGAEYTDVFIGLDYPPSSKYEEGWHKIDEYLESKSKNNGFNSLVVDRRQKNYGSIANYYALLNDRIKGKYNFFLSSEDDNEFSPNFLEFINKCNELFYENKKIVLISGYAYPDLDKISGKGNVVALHKAAAWGCGRWLDKNFTYEIIGGEKYRDKILFSWKESFRLFMKRPISLNSLISMKLRNTMYGDGLMIDCLLLEDKYCVFPRLSKVRNWGQDGSGEHSGKLRDDFYSRQEIDESKDFEYTNIEFSNKMPYDFDRKLIIVNFALKYVITPIIVPLRYVFFRLTGKDLFYFRFHKAI